MQDKNSVLLKKLGILSARLRDVCFFAVFGGFAIDAYYGSLTRVHEDIDMICWRNDLDKIREVLKDIGYNTGLHEHHRDRELVYKMDTRDDNKTFSFQIADLIDLDTFDISFWPYAHLNFPLSYLDVSWKELGGESFPVVDCKMLVELKLKQIKMYEKTKKIDFGKFIFKQKNKYEKAIHDVRLLTKK